VIRGESRSQWLIPVMWREPDTPHQPRLLAYPGRVTEQRPLEDGRGVDVAHIRALLRLSPAQRLAHMVEVVNTMQAIRDHSRAARS
jgi:hypothetical protein